MGLGYPMQFYSLVYYQKNIFKKGSIIHRFSRGVCISTFKPGLVVQKLKVVPIIQHSKFSLWFPSMNKTLRWVTIFKSTYLEQYYYEGVRLFTTTTVGTEKQAKPVELWTNKTKMIHFSKKQIEAK